MNACGVLVLGMHRSGTAGLTIDFHSAEFNAGSRVVGGGAGNEQGHWEDQLSVRFSERLLHRFGARWDSPFAPSAMYSD